MFCALCLPLISCLRSRDTALPLAGHPALRPALDPVPVHRSTQMASRRAARSSRRTQAAQTVRGQAYSKASRAGQGSKQAHSQLAAQDRQCSCHEACSKRQPWGSASCGTTAARRGRAGRGTYTGAAFKADEWRPSGQQSALAWWLACTRPACLAAQQVPVLQTQLCCCQAWLLAL